MTKSRVGFLGTGWIGRLRMEAIVATGEVEAVALVDPSRECAEEALKLAPEATVLPSLDALLNYGLDGLVIATPSALHAEQAIAALDRGIAVFCQKPLGRNAAETRAVVEAAERADRLLAVDFSYRLTAATQGLVKLLATEALGELFAINLVFHNAYGPDKPWFYDREQAGGGCVTDLGVHLVDLALWLTGFPRVDRVTSSLFAGGKPLLPHSPEVEDFALARLDLSGGISARLACSWNLHAGQDAVIEASLYGTRGGATIRNVGGSFFDFELLHHEGTRSTCLANPPDDWSGRAAAQWTRALARDRSFNDDAIRFPDVAVALDRIYAAAVT